MAWLLKYLYIFNILAVLTFGLMGVSAFAAEVGTVPDDWHTLNPQATINAGVDVNAKDSLENTALIVAAETANLDDLLFLLNKGADINAKGNEGNTALMAAAYNENPDIVLFLLTKGADVNAKDNNGNTAFMVAAYKQKLDVASFLFTKGADINAKGWVGDKN